MYKKTSYIVITWLLLGKLHLANRTQAALYALREGLASL
jgi:hypothetical protein